MHMQVARTPRATLSLFLCLGLLASAAAPDPSWMKLIGGPASDRAYAVAADAAGNCYITGTIQGQNVMFGTHVAPSDGSTALYVAKFDRRGSNVWVWTTGNSDLVGRGVAVDPSGNVYVCGENRT